MFDITFPDERQFNGVYLSVKFINGNGKTDSKYLSERFAQKGLLVNKRQANAKPPQGKPKKQVN